MIYSKTLYFNKVICYKLIRYKAKHFKRSKKMARSDMQVNFRMPHEIVEELKAHAKQERRSVTSQLNMIVEEWIKQKQKESAKA